MCGSKHATSTSKVSIPPEVLARYNAVNARAETAANTPYKAFGNTASDYVAQMNAQQNAGINDINATAGSYQPYMTQATQATQAGMGPAYAGIENYMSPYIKNVADTTGAMMKQQYEQAQSGALGTAAQSGAFGGDRAGIAAANLQQQNQMGYGKTMADIMNQGYTQALGASQADLARQLQGGAQMAQLGSQSQQLGLQGAQAKIAAGTMQQQTEQAGKDAMIQRFMQEQGYPFQTAQFLANIAMGTGAAQGSTTTSTTPLGIFGNLATGGRVGGYADGGGVAGPRTYSQGTIGGESYVPAGDLPVGQLMVAPPPDQQQGNGTEDIIKLIASTMGAKNGGVIDGRHGYALDGGVHPTHWNPDTQKYEMEPTSATGVVPAVTPTTTPTGVAPVVTPTTTPTGVVTPAATPEPTPSGWDTFAPKVRARESGGDYNALLGMAQQDGGKFAGTNLTDMTVNQAIEFSQLGSPYAQYAKDKLGYVATPMGAYQIVGKTLRGLRDELGLTGDEKMTPELQDALAKHLYDTQGGKPWAASADGAYWNGIGTDVHAGTMGDPNQQYEGGVKPYEDRNMIGKFFHNPDGSISNNAVMSLLSGLGTMAATNTISPISAILQGIAGGNATYKELLKQTPEVVARNIENTNALQSAFMREKELGYQGNIEDFAKSQQWQNSPFKESMDEGSSVPAYMGIAPVDIYGSGSSVPVPITDASGKTYSVPAGSTYGYLTLRRDLLTSKAALGLPGAQDQINAIDQKLKAIADNNGFITSADGTPVLDPSFAETQSNSLSRDVKNTYGMQVIDALPKRNDAFRQNTASFDRVAQAFGVIGKSGMSMGPATDLFKGVGTTLSQIGLPFNSNATDAWAAMDVIGKEMAKELTDQGVQLTDNARAYMNGSQPNIGMQKAAVAEILAAREALLEREKNNLAAIQNAGADPAAIYQADLEGRNQPVDWQSKVQKYNDLLGVGQENAAPAPPAFNVNETRTLQDENGNRVVGKWDGTTFRDPAGNDLGTGQ